jgi:hypothetical protein
LNSLLEMIEYMHVKLMILESVSVWLFSWSVVALSSIIWLMMLVEIMDWILVKKSEIRVDFFFF